MRLISKSTLLSHVIILAISFGTTIYARSVSAHANSIRWYSSTVKFQNSYTPYGTAILHAAQGYDSTDLVARVVPLDNSRGVIQYYYEDKGAGNPTARAQAWNGANNCFSWTDPVTTGYCNTTTNKADYGRVYLNAAYASFIDSHADFIMKHEAGHILGMAHGPCDEVSVMKVYSCGGTFWGTLQTHDVNTMNSWY